MKPTTWQDNSGRTWNCKIAISDVIRLKGSTGFDLLNPEHFKEMLQDILKQIETIAELLRPQWEENGLKYNEFVDLMTEYEGRFELVQSAFSAAVENFSLSIGRKAIGELMHRTLLTMRQLEERALMNVKSDKMQKALDKMVEDVDKQIDEGLKKLGNSFGNAQG